MRPKYGSLFYYGDKLTKVEILRHPTEEDWQRCKMLAMNTIRMEVPYWVSVHFVRHKLGVEHFVTSQRNDRQDKYDRNEAPQGMMVTHIMDINAEALIHMAHMRLCFQAKDETREAMRAICNKVIEANPEFGGALLVPKCIAHGGCDEFRSCGFYYRDDE